MAATKMVFHHMVLIFHSFKGFSDLEDFWDDLPVSRLKYNALEDFQDDLLGSLLTESSHMSLFHNRSELFWFLTRWFSSSTWICFSDLEQTLEDLWEVFSKVF
ncbi:hypothetical protein F2Q68_00009092 [Brassica cretica]|uniref:Uncharacterized protein n=1 Tax=Brassica cretica TaxID=69181 RepID=A0A8S9KLD5_BRACR|nr:hypothetical protein F2Q68_00009092 [Brassica cretica]